MSTKNLVQSKEHRERLFQKFKELSVRKAHDPIADVLLELDLVKCRLESSLFNLTKMSDKLKILKSDFDNLNSTE